MMISTPGWEELSADTEAAFDDPQVGDRFQEMYSFWMWMYVLHVGRHSVTVMHAIGEMTLPGDGTIVRYESHDEFRKAYSYGSIPGYFVYLSSRGNDVAGWL